METQVLKILEHLKEYKSITSWEAIKQYRITRLSAVIYVLRSKGYDIQSIREYNPKTNTPFARYVLLRKRKNK